MQQKVNAIIGREGVEGIAKKLNTIGQTLQIIIDGLTQPEGFDFRTGRTNLLSPFWPFTFVNLLSQCHR